jgi:uncharacterized protein YciI
MKAVVIGEPSGASMEQIMAVYPRHKALVDRLVARGEVIGIGPFADLGNMGIFRTRQAAEEFVREDPFVSRSRPAGACRAPTAAAGPHDSEAVLGEDRRAGRQRRDRPG